MENQIEGKVMRLKQNPKNYFITVDGGDYSGFGQAECKVGNSVKFGYKQSGKYKNIEDLEIVDDTEPASINSDIDDRREDIHLQVCLKLATTIISKSDDLKNGDNLNELAYNIIADDIVDLANMIKDRAWGERRDFKIVKQPKED